MRALLRFDGCAGLLVGLTLVFAGEPLAAWLTLPPRLLNAMGLVNLAYGAYSLPLSFANDPPASRIRALVAANFVWAVFCVLAAALVDGGALGRAYLVGEGLFVGALAFVERRVLLRLQRNRAGSASR